MNYDVVITVFFFSVILIGLVAMHAFYVMETNKEKKSLINALIAKNPDDYRNLTLADKVAPIKPQDQKPPDMIPLDQLSEEDFDAHISDELANG